MSWEQLLAIIREPVEQPPEDFCPNDGQPLETDRSGDLRCPFDGYRRSRA